MDDHHIYQQLPDPQQSIRLLSIAPGWPSDPIAVTLVTIQSLENAPPYDALSYVWGKDLDSEPIVCNGVAKTVTTSLGTALRSFRPLPSTDLDEVHQNGVESIDRDDLLHSSRHIWRDIAINRKEKPVSDRAGGFLVWIDALCINQDDLSERSTQVAIMRQIYQRACRVCIWFGDDLNHSTSDQVVASSRIDRLLGRDHLAEYGDMPVVLSFVAQAVKNAKGSRSSFDGTLPGFPPHEAQEWTIMRRFFQHPWFYRVWTVQEVAVAGSAILIVGDWELSWEALVLAVEYLDNSYHHFSLTWKSTSSAALPIDSASYMCHINWKEYKRPLLLGLLSLGRNRGATEPVDYVYAVINLSTDWYTVENGTISGPAIEIDYTIPVSLTFLRVAIWLILFHRSLDVLSFVEKDDDSELSDCPSWVPIWSKQKRTVLLAHGDYAYTPEYTTLESPYRRLLRDTGYTADLGQTMLTKPFKNSQLQNILLTVEGVRLSSIIKVSDALIPNNENHLVIRDDPSPEELAFMISAWNTVKILTIPSHHLNDEAQSADEALPLARRAPSSGLKALYKTRSELLHAFILTIAADRDENFRRVDEASNIIKDGEAWLHRYLVNLGQSPEQTSFLQGWKHWLGISGDRHNFQNSITLKCSWRRLFITASGHMGIGPASMREGDLAVVLFGSTIPFVIRPFAGIKDRFQLVGECYVHGIMDGELVREWKSTNLPAEMFELR